MKKFFLSLMLTVLCLLAVSASADSYHFSNIYMSLEVPVGSYPVQLTPDNLSANESSVIALGETVDSLRQQFDEEGILLMAFDETHGRTFVVTAVADSVAKQIYDINEQTANTRASYRTNHSNGTYCGALGYKFESCEWKNFGTAQGRFLMLKYVLKQDGSVVRRGLWRRTVRNGYTITLDMRIKDRKVTSGDITALNAIQETVSFTQITGAPDEPLSVLFTALPPETTSSATFTIKGTTKPGATVRAAYVSMKSAQSQTYTATADGNGAFALEVTLGSKDLYNMIVSVVYNEGQENEEEISQNYQVEYDPTLLPITFTSALPEVFTEDTCKIAGTTLSGVTVQLDVNGKVQKKSTGNAKTFSFTIDTSEAGTYEIYLSFTRKDYASRVLNYTIERVMDEDAQRQKTRSESISPDYTKLKNKPDTYSGKTLRFKGYIVSVEEGSGEWLMTFATKKSNETYSSLMIVISDTEISCTPGDYVTLYGTGDGSYYKLDDNGKNIVYPRLKYLFYDSIEN